MKNIKDFLNSLSKPYVIIMVGTPLVGKDTFIRRYGLEEDCNVISRDRILLDVYGDDDYNMAYKLVDQSSVDKILISEIKQSAKNRDNVVINMTNLTRKRRTYNLSFFDDDYYKVAICFPILSDEEYQFRNSKRTAEENKTIPTGVIRNMINSYQPVDYNEGFDKIINL